VPHSVPKYQPHKMALIVDAPHNRIYASTMPPTFCRSGKLVGVLVCFFLSGAAGLIYQVAWGKELGLIFGHTVYAIATVLSVFMAGLAAGSAYLGSWNERHTRPIALYAWIELSVAAAGAFSLIGLIGVRLLYLAAYPAIGAATPLLLVLRFLGIAVVLFIPTFLMGGTLPILVRGLAREDELGVRISRLYWVNTLGAVTGTLLAGFVLLPALGLRLTIACAVVLNVLAGLIALQLSSASSHAEASASARTPSASVFAETEAEDSSHPSRSFLFFAFGVVGATAIAYEVAWTRLLATIFGSSTYAFTLMLATFLAGIVIGSFLFERWFARHRSVSLHTFSRTQTYTGLAALIFLALFQHIPAVVPPILRATHESFGGLILAQFVTSALAMLPAAIIFGFNFPAVVLLLTGGARSESGYSAVVGRAYAANTFGAIAGAIITGFWLIPAVGSFRVVALIAAINLLLAVAVELSATPPRARALALNAVLLLLVAFAGLSSVFYNRALTSFSTVLYFNRHSGSRLTPAESAATVDLPFVADGLNASIAVNRTDDYFSLTTNGKVDASSVDTPTQLLLGHLGAVVDQAPRRVLIVGFGSGMTISAVARYPDVQRIDCAEIEPAVIQAAPYLEKLNRGVLRDPRVHVVLDDARNFLLTSREHYDLIISEPSNPWIAGIATLFTDEYYAAARNHLAPGGRFVQWIQAYSLDPADLRMILATLSRHFPETTLWRVHGGDLIALNRTETTSMNFDRLRTLWRIPDLLEDYETLELRHPEGLVAYYALNDSAVRRIGAGSVLNTDDRTLLEYHAPRALLNRSLVNRNAKLLADNREGLLPASLDPAETRRTLEAAAETNLRLGNYPNSVAYLKMLENDPPSSNLEILRGQVQVSENHIDAAQAHFENAARLDPDSLTALHWLAVVAHKKKEEAAADLRVSQILQRDPKFRAALTDRVKFARDREDWPTAVAAQAALINATKNPAAIEFCRLGEFLLRMQNLAEAEKTFLVGAQIDPYSYPCNRNLAELYRETGFMDRARRRLDFIVRLFPDADPTVYTSLFAVEMALGDHAAAEAAIRKGRRLFPQYEAFRQPILPSP
jgi:spermidine synthase